MCIHQSSICSCQSPISISTKRERYVFSLAITRYSPLIHPLATQVERLGGARVAPLGHVGQLQLPRGRVQVPEKRVEEMGREELLAGLEHIFFLHLLGILIPTDFHIFQRGGPTTNQTF